MKSALSIQCLPLKGNKEEIYEFVDEAIAVIENSGLPYTVGPFETTIEGELEQVWEVAYQAHRAVLRAGAGKVISYIKLASGEDLGTTAEKLAKYRQNSVKTGENQNEETE